MLVVFVVNANPTGFAPKASPLTVKCDTVDGPPRAFGNHSAVAATEGMLRGFGETLDAASPVSK